MLRFTLLFLLPFIIYVSGEDSYNQNIRRSRPVPVLGRQRSIIPVRTTLPPSQPLGVVTTTELPVTIVTQPPQSVSVPQVIIQVLEATSTPAATEPAPAAMIPVQLPVVSPHHPVAPGIQPLASNEIQLQLPADSSFSQPEVPQVPKEEYEPVPELEPETETEADLILEPEFKTQPAFQTDSDLSELQPNLSPKYNPEIAPVVEMPPKGL